MHARTCTEHARTLAWMCCVDFQGFDFCVRRESLFWCRSLCHLLLASGSITVPCLPSVSACLGMYVVIVILVLIVYYSVPVCDTILVAWIKLSSNIDSIVPCNTSLHQPFIPLSIRVLPLWSVCPVFCLCVLPATCCLPWCPVCQCFAFVTCLSAYCLLIWVSIDCCL